MTSSPAPSTTLHPAPPTSSTRSSSGRKAAREAAQGGRHPAGRVPLLRSMRRPVPRRGPGGGGMSDLDRERLRDFLLGREDSPNAVVGAIYRGLRDRIDRGDFD